MDTTISTKPKSAILYIIKGAIISLIFSIILVLGFAVVLRFVDMSDSIIKIINQVIKALSIFLGCLLGLKKSKEHGLYKGIVLGLIYTVVAFLMFSLLDGSFAFSGSVMIDLCYGGIVGGLCGIINSSIR